MRDSTCMISYIAMRIERDVTVLPMSHDGFVKQEMSEVLFNTFSF